MSNTVTISLKNQPKARICMSCLICGESVPISEFEEARLLHGMDIHSKICDQCREAILYVRANHPFLLQKHATT